MLDLFENGVPLVKRLHARGGQPVEASAANICFGTLLASKEGKCGREWSQFFDHACALLLRVSAFLLFTEKLVVFLVDRLASDRPGTLLMRRFSETDALLV